MERCVGCAQKLTPENNYFSATSGGIFCSQCAGFSGQKVKITSGTIKLIRLFLKNKINNLVKLTVSRDDIRNTKVIAGEMVRWITE
jgi:recombinational DNA repair protein (RecF pathway)